VGFLVLAKLRYFTHFYLTNMSNLLDDTPTPQFQSAARKPKPITNKQSLNEILDNMELARETRRRNHEGYATRTLEEPFNDN
jgi:hypothetical protein